MPTSTYACPVIGAVAPRLEPYGITDQAALLDHDELVEGEEPAGPTYRPTWTGVTHWAAPPTRSVQLATS